MPRGAWPVSQPGAPFGKLKPRSLSSLSQYASQRPLLGSATSRIGVMIKGVHRHQLHLQGPCQDELIRFRRCDQALFERRLDSGGFAASGQFVFPLGRKPPPEPIFLCKGSAPWRQMETVLWDKSMSPPKNLNYEKMRWMKGLASPGT